MHYGKVAYLIIISIIWAFAIGVKADDKCEVATNEATRVHMLYCKGKVAMKKSYNATKKAKKICKITEKKGKKNG